MTWLLVLVITSSAGVSRATVVRHATQESCEAVGRRAAERMERTTFACVVAR